jgi:hypothetical protein
MADANRLAAALRYQQNMEGPVTMNPNIAEQGRKGRANMAPPTSVMDPRSRDYERRSRETENFLIGADILAGALPFAPLAKGAVMAAGKYAGPELARGLENYMVKSGAVLPMDVWHGSPHRFPPTAKNPLGEFDPMKIGTGEGAQAYGVGAGYLAENPQTARIYSADRAYVGSAMQGKPSTINFDDPAWLAQKTIDEFGDTSKATSHLKMVQRTAAKQQSPETKAQVQAAIDLLESGNIATKGNLYKVDLPDENIAKMLDWDKPLSQQGEIKNIARKLGYFNAPELTREQVASMVKETGNANPAWKYAVGGHPAAPSPEQAILNAARLFEETPATWSGQRAVQGEGAKFYDFLENKLGTQEKASKILRDNGIPGIRYLDQNSRGKGVGTSNFVVFDPAHMNIIGRE